MKRRLIACVSLACAIGAGSCTGPGNGGGPATLTEPPASEPTSTLPMPGSEPTSTTPPAVDAGIGTEPTGSPGAEPTGNGATTKTTAPPATIPELCAIVCVRVVSVCPGALGGPDCAGDCSKAATQDFAACMNDFRTFLVCLQDTTLVCAGDGIDSSVCMQEVEALLKCEGAI
jgi:hypothetical protein